VRVTLRRERSALGAGGEDPATRRRAASPGSSAPITALITATASAPARTSGAAPPQAIPPIATSGVPWSSARSSPKRAVGSGSPASSLLPVT